MTNLMDDAALHFCLWKDRMDGVRKAAETVDTGDENVFDPSGLQVGNHTEPEVGPFTAVAHPVAQHIPMTGQVNGQHRVECCILDLALPPQLHMQRIQIGDGIVLLQRPVVPGFDQRPYFVRDGTDRRRGDIDAIEFVQHRPDVSCRVPSSIERQNLGLDLVAVGLVLLQQRRLEVTIAVSWHADGRLTTRGPQLLRPLAVAAVARFPALGLVRFIAQLLAQFRFQHRLQRLGKEPAEDATLAKKNVDALGFAQFSLYRLYRWQMFR